MYTLQVCVQAATFITQLTSMVYSFVLNPLQEPPEISAFVCF